MNLTVKIYTYLGKKNTGQILKYLGVSVGMYASVFLMMFIAVDVIGIPEMTAYVMTYALAYFANYIINLRYLYRRDHSWPTVIKYLSHIIFFLVFGSFIFKMFITINIHYLAATLLTAILLLPMRFLAYKFIVFTGEAKK